MKERTIECTYRTRIIEKDTKTKQIIGMSSRDLADEYGAQEEIVYQILNEQLNNDMLVLLEILNDYDLYKYFVNDVKNRREEE